MDLRIGIVAKPLTAKDARWEDAWLQIYLSLDLFAVTSDENKSNLIK